MFPGIGTVVNAAAILAGGAIGMLVKKGIPKRFQEMVFTSVGTAIFIMGIAGALSASFTAASDGTITSNYMLLLLLSLVIGGLIGELLRLDRGFDKVGEFLKNKLFKNATSDNIGVGFANTTVLFCAGAMAVLGAIEDGISGNPQMLFTKALMDGITALVMASTYGAGVMLSAIPVFLYQGALTLLASLIAPYFSAAVASQMSLVGSAVLMLLAFDLWDIKKMKVANLIPVVFLPLILSFFLG